MKHRSQPSDSAICVDSFRTWPWLFLFLLCGVTWLLPLSPAVNTLESTPRPPFSAPEVKEDEGEKVNSSVTDGILQKALEAAGCDKGYSSTGQDCNLLKETLGLMNTHLMMDKAKKNDAADDEGEFPWNQDPDVIPELKANCWCPAQFELSQVTYSNRVCANKINRFIRGLSEDSVSSDRGGFPQFPEVEPNKRLDETVKSITQRRVYIQRKDVFDRYNAFITLRTNFLLFVFGLVLLIPSLMWWKLSPSVWCGMNIDKTLDMLHWAQSCGPEALRKTYQDIVTETSDLSRPSGKTARCFLVCKTLVCCSSLAVVITVYHLVQPQAKALSVELEELSEIAKLSPFEDHFIFHCFFSIRQLQNVHDYTLQCLASFPLQGGADSSRNTDPHYQLDSARRAVLLYVALFQVVSAFLILHAIANFCGILGWIWKLYIDKNRFEHAFQVLRKPSGSLFSEDVRFFLHNTHEQLGHVISRELAKYFATSDAGAGSDEEDKL